MNKMKISKTYFLLLLVIFFTNISALKSNWPNNNLISNADKITCIQFQYLRGSNRVAEFQKIASLIFNESIIEENKQYSTTKMCLSDCIKALGNYDNKIDNKVIYTLLNTNDHSLQAVIFEDTKSGTIRCSIESN